MPWCPKCKTEYREGFSRCTDCGGALEDMPEARKASPTADAGSEVFLAGSNDAFTIQMMEEALKDADIPCICKRRGAGEILEAYMGVSWLGADLYVPTALLDKAKNTVAIFTDELHHIEPQGSLAVGRETAEPQRRKAARWIAAVYILSGVVPGIIVVLLWLLGVRLT